MSTAQEAAAQTPERAATLTEVLEWHAAAHPDRLHIHLYADGEKEERITYGALRAGAAAVAAGLVERGVERGGRVAIMLPTGRDYLFTFFGVLLAGGVPVPIYPPLRSSQLDFLFGATGRIGVYGTWDLDVPAHPWGGGNVRAMFFF